LTSGGGGEKGREGINGGQVRREGGLCKGEIRPGKTKGRKTELQGGEKTGRKEGEKKKKKKTICLHHPESHTDPAGGRPTQGKKGRRARGVEEKALRDGG